MKKLFVSYAVLVIFLTGCMGELIRKNDDRYMQTGALDPNLTGYYDIYNVSFLNKYRIRHEWPLPARACPYGSMPTLGKNEDRYTGEINWVNSIFEEAGQTWQTSSMGPSRSFDRYVRSQKVQRPDYDKDGKVAGYHEAEEGLRAICYESWVATNHSVSAMLFRRTLNEWQDELAKRPYHRPYVAPNAEQFTQQVKENKWYVYRAALQPMPSNGSGGPFELWILPVGDTNYTLALQFGANQESLKYPETHARFQTMFQHLIESVRIEPLTPAIAAEMEQLKAQAFEITRQECVRMNQTMRKPPAWCQKYLNP